MAQKKTTRFGRGLIEDTDLGWQAFKRSVQAFTQARPDVVAGVIGAPAGAVHKDSNKGENVATIGAKNEFGIGVPERSFLRSTFDANKGAYEKYVANGLQRELMRGAQARQEVTPDTSVTLKRISLKLEGDIKKRIAAQIPPPNAPSTIKQKGSSTPLIDKGQLRAAISAEMRKGGAR